MPFYEYICETCEHEFEAFQKMSDPPKSECPECGASVRKKIFAPPVILRGSGFYETEYGRSQHNHPNKSDSGSGGARENALNSSTKSESSSGGSSEKKSGGEGAGQKSGDSKSSSPKESKKSTGSGSAS